MKKLAFSGTALAILLAGTSPAYAYIDPTAGTFLLQILAAAGIGAAFYFRQSITAVKRFFGKESKPEKTETEKQEQDRD